MGTMALSASVFALAPIEPKECRCIDEDSIFPVVNKQVVQKLVKAEFGNFADTMGTKDKNTDKNRYFNSLFNEMKSVAQEGKANQCAVPAKTLRDLYNKTQTLAEKSITENTHIDLKKRAKVTKKIISHELYEGKTKGLILPKINEIRNKAFALGDCLKVRRPLEF